MNNTTAGSARRMSVSPGAGISANQTASFPQKPPEEGGLLRKQTSNIFARKLSSISPRSGSSSSSPVSILTKNLTFRSSLSKKRSQPASPKNDLAALSRLNTLQGPANPDVFMAPSFKPAAFGKDWSSDTIVLLNNAIRCETKDLFYILYCLHERADTLREGDIKSFYAWFEPYHDFFCTTIDIIHNVYLPWIEEAMPLPDTSSRGSFVADGGRLQRTVRKTLSHKGEVLELDPAKAAKRLRAVFSKLAPSLLSYMSKLEEITVPIIRSSYTIVDCRTLSGKIVSQVLKTPSYKRNIVILIHWLDSQPELQTSWKKEYLDRKSFVAFPIWKRPGAQEDCIAYFKKMSKTLPDEP